MAEKKDTKEAAEAGAGKLSPEEQKVADALKGISKDKHEALLKAAGITLVAPKPPEKPKEEPKEAPKHDGHKDDHGHKDHAHDGDHGHETKGAVATYDEPYPLYMENKNKVIAGAALVGASYAAAPLLQAENLYTAGESINIVSNALGVTSAVNGVGSAIGSIPLVGPALSSINSIPAISAVTGAIAPAITTLGGLYALGKLRNSIRQGLGWETENTGWGARSNIVEGVRLFGDPFRAIGWGLKGIFNGKNWSKGWEAAKTLAKKAAPVAGGIATGLWVGGLAATIPAYGTPLVIGAGIAGGLGGFALTRKAMGWLGSFFGGGGGGGGHGHGGGHH